MGATTFNRLHRDSSNVSQTDLQPAHPQPGPLHFLLKCLPFCIGALLPIISYADCTDTHCDEQKWRLIVGGQFTHRSPEIQYNEKGGSSPREVEVRKNFTEDRFLPFPSMRLEYRMNPVSSWDLTYSRDETHTSALTQEQINIIFFPIKLSLRVPVKMDMQSLKFFYNRAFFQSENLEFGGSLGMQVLQADAESETPIFNADLNNLIVPLPAVGAFASYSQSDRLTYHLRTNYLPLGALPLGSISLGGTIAEVNFSIEYQYSRTWMIGAGYRYSYLQLELDQEKYHVKGSHITYGPTFFVGASF